MSQENVEIVRAALDAYNRGDFEAMLEHAAPDLWTFDDGACARVPIYQERREALEAAGLSE